MRRAGDSRGGPWRRRRDERGATLVFTAITMVVLLWGGAMGVDLGFSVAQSRAAQAMADTAALDMTRYINLADSYPQSGSPSYSTYLAGKLAGVSTNNPSSGATLTAVGGT